MIYRADGVFKEVYLNDAEKALLSILTYFKYDTGSYNSNEDYNNLMMCPQFNKSITDLLKKIDNDLNATYYLVKIL